METQTKFDIMFEAINAHSIDKVADIVNVLAARNENYYYKSGRHDGMDRRSQLSTI
jgi:hypothetical protein